MAWFRCLISQWLRPVVGALVLTLLGLQLAVAAYACPRLSPPPEQPTSMAASMPDCHGQAMEMDPSLAPLCAAHCQPDPSTPTTPTTPVSLDQQPLPSVLPWLSYVLAVLEPSPARQLHSPGDAALAHAWAPPLFLTLQVLRN